jgi:cyclophilin family peptidyl-prolyl cis-trans isomerase
MSGRAAAAATMIVALVLALLPSCQSREEKEKELTAQCKRDAPCKKQGLCTGRCAPEPCVCVVANDADCQQSSECESLGKCSVKDGKCIVATNADCARAMGCKPSALCTAKDGACVVGSDSDCKQSELCKNQQRCSMKDGACIDASFNPALLKPDLANAPPPDKFKVKFTTAKGDFVVEVTKAWAPLAAERFYNLVKIGYYADTAIFRVDGNTVEFGVHGRPDVSAAWMESKIQDEPPKQPNERGYVVFPKSRPNSRWAPLAIHVASNRDLDAAGYAPFGKVIQGMNVLDALTRMPVAKSPDPSKVQQGGNSYLKASFPEVEYVKSAALLAN